MKTIGIKKFVCSIVIELNEDQMELLVYRVIGTVFPIKCSIDKIFWISNMLNAIKFTTLNGTETQESS